MTHFNGTYKALLGPRPLVGGVGIFASWVLDLVLKVCVLHSYHLNMQSLADVVVISLLLQDCSQSPKSTECVNLVCYVTNITSSITAFSVQITLYVNDKYLTVCF